MYFSLITSKPGCEREASHERLGGPYADHQWLWRWFPVDPTVTRDFLFRRHETGNGVRYYVLSARPPAECLGAWQAQSRLYVPQLDAGDRLAFELRANPTVRHGHDGKSKRHDVVMNAKRRLLASRGLTRWADWHGEDKPAVQQIVHDACSKWLLDRGQRLGFSIDRQSLMVDGYNQHLEQKDRNLRFTTVDIAGQLTVDDPQAFQTALLRGIGSGKAFGCGLMLIRRAG